VEPIPPKSALILVVQAAVLYKSPSCLVFKKMGTALCEAENWYHGKSLTFFWVASKT